MYVQYAAKGQQRIVFAVRGPSIDDNIQRILNWKSLPSLGEVDIRQCLEIFLVVLAEWGDAIGIQQIEARDTAQHPTMATTTLHSTELPRSSQSILKEVNPEYLLEGLMLKLQYLVYLMQRVDSLEKTIMLGKIVQEEKGTTEDEMIR